MEVSAEPLILVRNGEPIAALVAISNADYETVSLSSDPQFLAIIERSRLRQGTEGSISFEQMQQRLGLTDEDIDAARDDIARDNDTSDA
jgi:hypothetical protein